VRQRGVSGRRLILTAVAIALLAAVAAHLLSQREELEYLQRLSTAVVLMTLLCQFVSQMLWNEAMRVPLRAYMTLGFWELLLVRSGGFLVGTVVPVAGNVGVRMAYLKRRGLGYADFTWATVVSNVIALFAASVLGTIALGLLWFVAGAPPGSVVGLTVAVAAAGVAGLVSLRAVPRLAAHPRVERWSWLAALARHRTDLRTAGWILALSAGRHACAFVAFGLLYQSLARTRSGFLTGGLVYAITSPIRIVSLTPGNLGITEWVVAAVGKLLSFDVTTGLIVALVFRGLSLAAQVLGVLLAGAWVGVRGEP
jgi:Lysylphosphatidylglycerol synthase TM region